MKSDKILLDHGSGGKISHRLTTDMLLPVFDNPILAEHNDGAIFELNGQRMAFSTDSYTVDPIFFPGGSIGDLAINGTVNDVAMCGATPLYLSVGLIIEEGFAAADLEKIVKEMGSAARTAGVSVVTGDTKVVPKGAVDGIAAEPSYLDISVPPNRRKTLEVATELNAFAYVFAGAGNFRDASKPRQVATEGVGGNGSKPSAEAGNRSLILFDRGDEITVQAGEQGIRFLLVSGKPLKEPVAWYGPIVMNTRAQLRQAFAEFQAGTFLKHG